MTNLLAQLKRRQMFRIAAAYAVVAWLLLQLFNNLAPILELPSWVGRAFVLLLATGFPAAMFFAWMRELPPADAASDVKANKLDWILAGGLAAVIAIFAFQQLAPTGATTPLPQAQQAGVDAAKAAATSPLGAVSVAVLPFANMSGDASQEFFSDGMTEEITAALARIPDLRVVGRTSAFQFRGQNQDLRAIGQSLSATHLIEGSVRKAGERVRVTVQLINASDGTHLWTESYDRELTDIFAIQEDIGRAIAASLRMPLGLRPGESLVSNRTQDLVTYQDYLQARAWLRARLSPRTGPYIQTLESVVARDPSFAPAWAFLARGYALEPGACGAVLAGPLETAREMVKSFVDKAEAAGRKAIELDPENSTGHWALAYTLGLRGRWAEAEDLGKRAMELDPNDSEALHVHRITLLKTGQLAASLKIGETLRILDTLVPIYNITTAVVMQASRQSDAAISTLEAMPPGGLRNTYLARAYAGARRYSDAADTLLLSRPANPTVRQWIEDVARALRAAPTAARFSQDVDVFASLSEYNFVHAHLGALERVMEYPEREAAYGFFQDWHKLLWLPEMAPVRKTDRFKAFVRNTGLVDHWRERGWPDLCKPVGANDFACE